MKSNDDLGFKPLYGDAKDGYGDNRSEENDDEYARHASLHITIGQRGAELRLYGYLYGYKNDSACKRVLEATCGRGMSVDEAIANFRTAAENKDWNMKRVNSLIHEMRESLAETKVLETAHQE